MNLRVQQQVEHCIRNVVFLELNPVGQHVSEDLLAFEVALVVDGCENLPRSGHFALLADQPLAQRAYELESLPVARLLEEDGLELPEDSS